MLKKLLSNIKNDIKYHYIFIIIFSFVFISVLYFPFAKSIDNYNNRLHDVFFKLRYYIKGNEPIDTSIVHIDLTNEDVEKLNLQPWERKIYRDMISLLTQANAKIIGIDVLFKEHYDLKGDEELTNIVEEAGNVYFPYIIDCINYSSFNNDVILPEYHHKLAINKELEANKAITTGKILYYPFTRLTDKAGGLGHITLIPDKDGLIRKIPLIIKDDGMANMYYPHFTLRIISDLFDTDLHDMEINWGKDITLKDVVLEDGKKRNISIPIDKHGQMLINWAGKDNTFTHLSFSKVLAVKKRPQLMKELTKVVKDKIVIISDISVLNQDRGINVFHRVFPLNSVHSNVLNSILTDNFVYQPHVLHKIFIYLFLIVVLLFLSFEKKPLYHLLNPFLFYALFFVLNFLLFYFFNIISEIFLPSIGYFLSGFLILLLKIYRNEKQKIIDDERSKIKNNFFINIAHETKTPLTIILNYLDKAIKENGSSDSLAIIKKNVTRLNDDMINFLDYNKLEMGQFFYNNDLVLNVSDYVLKRTTELADFVERKNLKFSYTISENCFITMDIAAMDRVVNNVVDNAVKYNKKDGAVRLILQEFEDSVALKVSDTGIGIRKEDLKNIFKPFHQLSRIKNNNQGMGMGLTIVKKILHDINATIQIESELGEGSTITIHFKKYLKKIQDTCQVYTVYDRDHIHTPDIELAREEYRENKDTLFIIEDNHEMLSYLQNELMNNYNVYYSFDGSEALEKIKEIPIPDLIISDVMMNGMNGFVLKEMLNRDKTYGSIPLIFLSASTEIDKKLTGLKKGAIDYITKPFEMEELTCKIQSILNVRKMREAVLKSIKNKDSKTALIRFIDEHDITAREKKIILLMLDNKLHKEIAFELKITEGTVKKHATSIYKKLHVQNKSELINRLASLLR